MQLSRIQEPATGTQSPLTATSPQGLLAFEGYLIDRRRWLITHGGALIPLQRKAFDLLLYLLDRRDQVVAKETLIGALWNDLVVEESNVTQQIFLLRRALTKHQSKIKIIETIPGRGYRFVPSLEYLSEESQVEPPPAAAVQRVVPPTKRRWSGFLALCCALFALGGYGFRCWQDRADREDSVRLVSNHQAVPAPM